MNRRKLRGVTFANGYYLIDENNIDFKVRAAKDTQHGDWKTTSIHGLRTLFAGEEMAVEKSFANYEGFWLSGKNPRGQHVDLAPEDLIYVERDRPSS